MTFNLFHLPGVYGVALGVMILSGNMASDLLGLIGLFCRKKAYTLGNFGQVWANYHAIGCLFLGLTNLAVARDDEGSFGPKARSVVAMNTAFIYGVWGVQNTWYLLYRQELFLPLMWLNAIGCLATAAVSLSNAASSTKKKGQ